MGFAVGGYWNAKPLSGIALICVMLAFSLSLRFYVERYAYLLDDCDQMHHAAAELPLSPFSVPNAASHYLHILCIRDGRPREVLCIPMNTVTGIHRGGLTRQAKEKYAAGEKHLYRTGNYCTNLFSADKVTVFYTVNDRSCAAVIEADSDFASVLQGVQERYMENPNQKDR